MGKIIAIGGGEIGSGGLPFETIPIDKETIKLTGKISPHVIFLPTASNDATEYTEGVEKYFGHTFNCKVEPLYLLNNKLRLKETEKKLLEADIIYVGGGNTLKMMRRWRHLKIDKILKKAFNKGVVMSGVSAGAICWFAYGHSDSMSFYSPNKWSYIKVRGLNFLPFILCPHYDSETYGKFREIYFKEMIKDKGGIGIALDNCAAVEVVDDNFRIITSKKNARAYRVFFRNQQVIQEELPIHKGYTRLSKLYERI